MIVEIMTKVPIQVEVKFPLFLDYLEGDYGYAGFEKQYWKFESRHKLTIITERMSETTILTLDDERFDFVKEKLTEQMLSPSFGWWVIPEKQFDQCVQRLIDKLFKS